MWCRGVTTTTKNQKGEHQNRSHLCLHTSDICVLTQEFEKICTTLVNTTKSTIISLENRHTLSPSHYHDKERVRQERQRQTEEEKQWHQLTSQVQDVVVTLLQFNVSFLANTHTGFQCLTITFSVSLLVNTDRLSTLNNNIQCPTPGKHRQAFNA